MILHRLRLKNFRGVADREIAFPDHGVVVVCGPNEIGKSSMLEALDLLLTYKDRSGHRDVKAVKPTHADAGAEVEAEISTGPYRFVYRKRFHKKQMTELDVLEPRREQHTGDEAHQRVEAIMAETVDTKLWEAQRVLQSASTDAVSLSGSDALARALDASAGETDAGASGEHALLIDRIESECLRYFTATGRPTREWKTAIERLAAAEDAVAQCRLRVEEVDQRVSRHEELSAALRPLQEQAAPAGARLTAAQRAHTAVLAVADQLATARLQAETAAANASNNALANDQRRDLIADVTRRAETLAGLQQQVTAAAANEAAARQASETAAAAAGHADTALAGAQARFDTAEAAAVAAKVAARVRKIDDAEKELGAITAQLAAVTVTDDRLADIEKAAALVATIEAQLQSDAGTVEFIAATDLEVTVDADARTLTPDTPLTQPATAAVTVEVPGVMTVRINPGATALTLRANLDAARKVLAEALEEAGAADLAAARTAAQLRQTLSADAGKLTAALDVLLDGEGGAELRARSAELHAAASGADIDTAAAAAALSAARADADTLRQAAVAAAAALADTTTTTTLLRQRVESAEAELAEVAEKLTTLRATVADETLAVQAATHEEALRTANAAVADLAAKYAATDPAAVEAELAAAGAAADAISAEVDAISTELNTLTIELGVMGGEGRQGDLDEAEAGLERATAEFTRIGERARAAQLLRDTMIRHRDDTRARYVQPYRTELERLGRIVFGDEDFQVDVDPELNICSRTFEGRTVPYESLSGGAKEQLGILARLAGAALVAKEDTVPVVIDDALGFSDPVRLKKMGAVFNTVGDRGQVIVLTCTPGRFDGIADAEIIELSA